MPEENSPQGEEEIASEDPARPPAGDLGEGLIGDINKEDIADENYERAQSRDLGGKRIERLETEKMQLANMGRRHELSDLKRDSWMKLGCSIFFGILLVLQLIMMNWIFLKVGKGDLAFKEYELHLYMTGTLAEVFFIVYIIVRYLFPKR